MTCYFCLQEIGPDQVCEMHHPDKENFPDWTEPAHDVCHTRYHSRNGHFRYWGGLSSTSGRPGYEYVIAAWPAFHVMGGKHRARTARRNKQGKFC